MFQQKHIHTHTHTHIFSCDMSHCFRKRVITKKNKETVECVHDQIYLSCMDVISQVSVI